MTLFPSSVHCWHVPYYSLTPAPCSRLHVGKFSLSAVTRSKNSVFNSPKLATLEIFNDMRTHYYLEVHINIWVMYWYTHKRKHYTSIKTHVIEERLVTGINTHIHEIKNVVTKKREKCSYKPSHVRTTNGYELKCMLRIRKNYQSRIGLGILIFYVVNSVISSFSTVTMSHSCSKKKALTYPGEEHRPVSESQVSCPQWDIEGTTQKPCIWSWPPMPPEGTGSWPASTTSMVGPFWRKLRF